MRLHGRPDFPAHGVGIGRAFGLLRAQAAQRKSSDSVIAPVPPLSGQLLTLLRPDIPTMWACGSLVSVPWSRKPALAPGYGVMAPVPAVRLIGPRWTTYQWPRQEISEKIPKEPSFPATVR